RRELVFVVVHHPVGPPMGRKNCGWRQLACTETNRLSAIATVFRSKHEFALEWIVITLRPTVVASVLEAHHLFRRTRSLRFRLIEVWPVGVQLISSVLSHKDASGAVYSEAFAVAYACCVTIGGGKGLVGLIGVITPDAAACFKFLARLCSRHSG